MNLFTSYSFHEGLLKGASIGGGYRHQSKNPIGLYAPRVLQYGPSYWDAHLMLGYRLNNLLWFKRVSLQLNIANLFDETSPLVIKRTLDGTEINRRVRLRDPRSWRLSANVDF
jgi:outer membrane receptor for monomeric catechols